jgi:RimJ/RimL family protein N-acetyltransferase
MRVDEMPLFYEWATRSDSTPYWYEDGNIPTREQFWQDWKIHYFDGSEPENGRCFTIVVESRPVGQVNYNQINRENNSVELDIIIASDSDKNKGYGSEALSMLAGYLFWNMKIRKCWIEPTARNARAIRAYEKAGFRITHKFLSGGTECVHMEIYG